MPTRDRLLAFLLIGGATAPATASPAKPTAVTSATASGASTVSSSTAAARGATPATTRFGGADAPYLDAVHARLHPKWSAFITELARLPPGTRFHDDPGLAAELLVTVDGAGRVVATSEPVRAGLDGFDQAPLEMLRDVGRLPAPPPALRSDDGVVHLRLRFTRDAHGCARFAVLDQRLPPAEAIARLVADDRSDEAVARVRELFAEDADRGRALLTPLAAALARAEAASADPVRRVAACAVLQLLDDGEAPLLRLAADRDAAVRHAAMAALAARPRSSSAHDLLVAALAGPDAAPAADALRHLGVREAVPALRAALEEGRAVAPAARALEALGDGREAGAIATRLMEARGEPRTRGAVVCEALADPSLAPSLLGWYPVTAGAQRVAFLGALAAPAAATPPASRAAVYRALKDPAAPVRARAAGLVPRFGDRSAANRYRLTDLTSDPDAEVRAAAGAALVEVGGEAARDEILHLLRDRAAPVRLAVARALVEHPIDGTVAGLRRAFDEADARARAQLAAAARASARADLAPLVEQAAADAAPEVRAAATPPAGATASDGDALDPDRLRERLLGATSPLDRLRAAAAWVAAESAGEMVRRFELQARANAPATPVAAVTR